MAIASGLFNVAPGRYCSRVGIHPYGNRSLTGLAERRVLRNLLYAHAIPEGIRLGEHVVRMELLGLCFVFTPHRLFNHSLSSRCVLGNWTTGESDHFGSRPAIRFVRHSVRTWPIARRHHPGEFTMQW